MAKPAPIEDREIFIRPAPIIGGGKVLDGGYNTIFMTREDMKMQFPDPRKVAPKSTPKSTPKPTTDKNINRTLDRVVARITAHKPPR